MGIWSPVPFINFHDAISEALADPLLLDLTTQSKLQELFDVVSDDLKNLFDAPPKSPAHRELLRSGEITINDVKYRVNQEFINEASELSDELSIDELTASEILLNSQEPSKQSHTQPIQASIATFHLRRQYILNIIAFIVGDFIEQGPLATKMQSFAKTLESGPTTLFSRVLSSLKSIEANFASLDEKESRGAILGQLESLDFRNQLKLERDFLLIEHQNLAQILYKIIQKGSIKYTSDFITLIQHIRLLDTYNNLLIDYIPAVHAISLQLDPYLSTSPQNLDLPAIANIAKEFKDAKAWKLGYWKGLVQFIFYTYATGLYRSKYVESDGLSTPNPANELDFKADLQDPIKESIDDGALELLMFMASDINPSSINFEPFYDFRPDLKFCVADFKSLGRFSAGSLDLIYSSLEKLAEGVITNLADVLREMRLNEEDMYLANAQREIYDGVNEENVCGVDLERFFIFICCLYYDRPDAALPFWVDQENDLYNFVLWASQCDIVFMATAFSAMLASLASGPACALAVHKFLSEHATNPSFASRTRKIAKLSWSQIIKALFSSIKNLKPPQPPPSSLLLSKAKVIADIPELDSSDVWILTTYLQILSQVVKYSPEARDELLSSYLSSNGDDKRQTKPENTNGTNGTLPPPTPIPGSKSLIITTPLPTAAGSQIQQPLTEPPKEKDNGMVVSVLFEFLSFYTPLFGPILYTLSGFALSDSQQVKDNLWTALDQWLFNTTIAFPQNEYLSADVASKERLFRLMSSFPTVYGLVSFLEALLRPSSSQQSDLYSLPFPENLGGKYRSPGLWPYIDFIINEVFVTSTTSTTMTEKSKLQIQLPTIKFILHCLQNFDPEIPIISASAGIDINVIVKTQTFQDFIQIHPSSIAMSYLFSTKVYTPLLQMASVGIDVVSDLPEDSSLVSILIDTLRVINDILNLQNIFIDTVKKNNRAGDSGPIHLSTHGLSSFEEAILFNLSIISHLALYTSSPNATLARLSLSLLDRVSHSTQFSTPSYSTVDSRIRGNRLLSILEAADDSVRIKEGFIEQLSRPLDSYVGSGLIADAGLKIKEEILKFLISNLPSTYKEASISHLLLGFKINSDGSLSPDSTRGGIFSETSILETIIQIAYNSSRAITGSYIPYQPARISSLCYKIIRLLIKNSLSTGIMIEYLREKSFFLTSLKSEPIVDSRAIWDDITFADVPEFYTSYSARAFLSFIDKRASLLECLSIELHAAALSGSLSTVSRYMEALANMKIKNDESFETSSATKILSFLDVVEYTIPPKERLNEETISTFGEQLVAHILRRDSELDDQSAIAELTYLLRLKGLELMGAGHISSLSDPSFVTAIDSVIISFTRNRLLDRLRSTQLSCLQAWSKLLLVVVNDSDLAPNDRTNLLLEVFQAVVYKLKFYSTTDSEYAENLASLLVSLYSIYLSDINAMERTISYKNPLLLKQNSAERTHPLFKAVISSILTSNSTPTLRSELYVIAYKYLKNVLSDDSLTASSPIIRNCLQSIRGSGDKLIELICNDALNGEGTTRLTAYILLEVFSTLSIRAKSTFLLDTLVKYNMLLLIVRSISSCDEEIVKRDDLQYFYSSTHKRSHLSGVFAAANRHYQIMIFKSIVSLLLQLARTRHGAHQITQCGLFEILKTCKFLRIDPDVGIDVRLAFNPVLTNKKLDASFSKGEYLSDPTIAGIRNFRSVLFRAFSRSYSGTNDPSSPFYDDHLNINNSGTNAFSSALNGNGSAAEAPAPFFAVFQYDPQETFYYLVNPTFQLITATLLSLGSENEPVISRVRSFLQSHELLVVALLRKDVLARGKPTDLLENDQLFDDDLDLLPLNKKPTPVQEEKQQMEKQDSLSSLVNHIVLLISLTNYVPGISQN